MRAPDACNRSTSGPTAGDLKQAVPAAGCGPLALGHDLPAATLTAWNPENQAEVPRDSSRSWAWPHLAGRSELCSVAVGGLTGRAGGPPEATVTAAAVSERVAGLRDGGVLQVESDTWPTGAAAAFAAVTAAAAVPAVAAIAGAETLESEPPGTRGTATTSQGAVAARRPVGGGDDRLHHDGSGRVDE